MAVVVADRFRPSKSVRADEVVDPVDVARPTRTSASCGCVRVSVSGTGSQVNDLRLMKSADGECWGGNSLTRKVEGALVLSGWIWVLVCGYRSAYLGCAEG